MKKYLLFMGALAGFGLMAFFGPTKADQMKEIEVKVKTGLDELRAAEKGKCDARVEEAVAAKVAEMSATPAPEPMPAPAPAKGGVKKGTKGSGPKATTVPPPPPPPPTKSDVKTRGGAVQEGTDDVKKRGGAVQEGTQDVKKRGGAVKVEGGGGN